MSDLGAQPPPDDPLREIEDAEVSTVEILHSQRPVPAPAFRGDLRRRLISSKGTTATTSALRISLGAQIAGCLGAGLVLLAVAGIGLAGAGPFGA